MSARMFSLLGATIFAAVGYKLNIGEANMDHLFAFTLLGAIVGGIVGWRIRIWWDDL